MRNPNRRTLLRGVTALTAAGPFAVSNAWAQATPARLQDSVKALVFDVFGTVVDWRNGVAREAQSILAGLASVFYPTTTLTRETIQGSIEGPVSGELPGIEAIYRTLVEQIPAVVFMALLDKGIGEAYVSPPRPDSFAMRSSEGSSPWKTSAEHLALTFPHIRHTNYVGSAN